jgi:hypothetical protein
MYQIWFVFRNLQLDCKACLQWFWILEVDILLTIIAAPFFIIFRTKRALGYGLFTLIIFTSLIIAYAILKDQGILFEPYKIFNMAQQFTINYQTNSLVRLSPYFLGLMFGLFINEGLEKTEGDERPPEHKIAKSIRRNPNIQMIMHIVGLSLMIATYLLIIPYLPLAEKDEVRDSAYGYLPSSMLLARGEQNDSLH